MYLALVDWSVVTYDLDLDPLTAAKLKHLLSILLLEHTMVLERERD